MDYVLAGYYLVRLRPLGFGPYAAALVPTASCCINDPLLDSFSRPWTSIPKVIQQAQTDFSLSSETIHTLQQWVEAADMEEQAGYMRLFYTLEAARTYYQRFFQGLNNVVLLGLFFLKSEAIAFKNNHTPTDAMLGEMGMSFLCGQAIPEEDTSSCLGYEPIGLDAGGSFHSMHCYTALETLQQHFELTINTAGLLTTDTNWAAMIDFLNHNDNGFTTVPWYFAIKKMLSTALMLFEF